ncbi:hypothetical protein [Prevotella sp.]|uniref:hypothetical protein n=1 Tax=uncultured Prevotella sp. TaxID=159272 RepID=UPI00262D9386|nr:hypothetical protein [uncultured Prevotella sp.]
MTESEYLILYIWGVECLFNPRCSAFARVMLVGNGKLPTFSKKLTDLLEVSCLFIPMKSDGFFIAEAATGRGLLSPICHVEHFPLATLVVS